MRMKTGENAVAPRELARLFFSPDRGDDPRAGRVPVQRDAARAMMAPTRFVGEVWVRLAVWAALAIGLLLVASPCQGAHAEPSSFDVSFLPPGLLLRGEEVTFSAFVASATGEAARGDLFVRGDQQTSFSRVPLSGDSPLTARVPAAVLAGSVLDSYVVVVDQISGESVTVPSAGRKGPHRSWIVEDPMTVELRRHRFGHIRQPDAIVVDAAPGDGRGEIGIACPPEGICDSPQSFDVAPDGTVWVADIHNNRLVSWMAGTPGKASRTIPLDYAPADLAVAPDGAIYVWGSDPGVGMRIHAVSPNGTQRWSAPAVSDIFNDHVRIQAWTPYLRSSQFGWIPLADADGDPIGLTKQRKGALRDQPLALDQRLVITSTCALDVDCEEPHDARVALVEGADTLQAAWLVTSPDVLVAEPEDAIPSVVEGDPVLVSALYDFDKHLKEYEVLRLGADGSVLDRFSLGRGVVNGDIAVTNVRIGTDGDVYQMQYDLSHPELGMQIARYELAGSPSPTPTESPTPPPTTVSPTAGSPSLETPTGSAHAPAAGGWSTAAWIGVSLGGLLAGLGTTAFWLRRRPPRTTGNGVTGREPDPDEDRPA
jgi:hypothetical protein